MLLPYSVTCLFCQNKIDPKGRDVLVIEDLIDTGNTLKWLVVSQQTNL